MRICLAATVILLVSTPALAEEPPPDLPRIQNLTYGGPGCPAGSVYTSVRLDGSFTVGFDRMLALIGPGVALAESRKSCTVRLEIVAPPGYTYAIAAVDHSGSASVAAGATAEWRSEFYFPGPVAMPLTYTTIPGPFESDWVETELVATDALRWAPCGAGPSQLILVHQVRLRRGSSAPDSSSFIALDNLSEFPGQLYHLAWKACTVEMP